MNVRRCLLTLALCQFCFDIVLSQVDDTTAGEGELLDTTTPSPTTTNTTTHTTATAGMCYIDIIIG